MRATRLSRLAMIGALAFITAAAAQGQSDYPNRPIKLIVGFAAGRHRCRRQNHGAENV